jgi:hypothetical protein
MPCRLGSIAADRSIDLPVSIHVSPSAQGQDPLILHHQFILNTFPSASFKRHVE